MCYYSPPYCRVLGSHLPDMVKATHPAPDLSYLRCSLETPWTEQTLHALYSLPYPWKCSWKDRENLFISDYSL